jgi:hypothetical protein
MTETNKGSMNLDIGGIKVTVKLQESGVALDVFKKNDTMIGFCRHDQVIKSDWKTYEELGVDITNKNIEDGEDDRP